MNISIEMILIGIFIFSALGVYIKLRRYGAPIFSFIYSGVIPIVAMIIIVQYGWDNILVSNEKRSFLKKLKNFFRFEFECLKKLHIITGLICIDLKDNQFFELDVLTILSKKNITTIKMCRKNIW